MTRRSGSDGTIRGLALWAGIANTIGVSAYLRFEIGRIQGDYNIIEVAADRRAFVNRIEALEDEIASLKEEVALLQTHSSIDKAAYKDVEANLTQLQRKIQEQRDAIEFYRGIISPTDGGRGLRVQDLKLSKGTEDREYNVRLVLVQVMQHDRSVKGEVDFSLDGAQDGAAVTYTLEQLLPPDADNEWSFSFRYFQNFDRQLLLPEGFKPERVNIEVRSKTKSIASVKQSFPWQSV
jgi:uncharacterized protein (UPF0335 family)